MASVSFILSSMLAATTWTDRDLPGWDLLAIFFYLSFNVLRIPGAPWHRSTRCRNRQGPHCSLADTTRVGS